MNSIYNEAIEVGKTHSGFSIVYQLITIIIFIVFIFLGYKYFQKLLKDDFIDTTATIIDSKCNYYTPEKSAGKYSCNLDISYFINGKKYLGNVISDTGIHYKPGSKIRVSYHNEDPNVVKIKGDHEKIIYPFFGMFSVVLTIILLSSVIRPIYDLYMAKRYGVFSSIYGTGAAFRHGIRSAL